MSEQADKPLHDWVRQSLAAYRPEPNPDDWLVLRRQLRRRRWQRWSLWLAGLFMVGIVSWWLIRLPVNRVATQSVPVITPISPTQPDKPLSNALSVQSVVRRPIQATRKARIRVTNQPVDPPKIPVSPTLAESLSKFSLLATRLTEQIPQRQPVRFSSEEKAIAHQLFTNSFGDDSTSYRVLDRNLRRWPDAVLVCDFTTSMYPYSTQLFAWFKQHIGHPSIKGMVFFTDCDSLGRPTQPNGPPGQMYVAHGEAPAQVLPTLLAAARNTVQNDDDAENDVEALLYAQKHFPEASHLILLADNISRVKDIARVSGIHKPVHVILCGTTGSDTALAYQPDYYTIARQTNGSLHTLEDDIDPKTLSHQTTLRVGARYFRYLSRRGRFKPTPFDHRPKRVLKFIWF